MAGRKLRRRVVDWVARGLAAACILVAVVPLGDIILTAIQRGHLALAAPGYLSWGSVQPLPCSGCGQYGGIGAELQGSFYLLLLASAIAIPVGIVAGIFLAEYGRNTLGRAISFLVDILSGVPSIVVGVFIYFVIEAANPAIVFSAFTGALALVVIMLPLIVRTTEESLRLVPQATREAALALGIPRYRSTVQIVLPGGAAAVVTGALLAVARAGGEAAPFFIVGFASGVGFQGWNEPVTPLPVLIYNLSQQPFQNWLEDAWAAVLVLMMIMLALSLTARFFLGRRSLALGGV